MQDHPILNELEELRKKGLESLQVVQDELGLQNWKVANLGRSAPMTQIFSQMKTVSAEVRPLVGERVNQVKKEFEAALEEHAAAIKQAMLNKSLTSDAVDISLPGRRPAHGRLHPQTKMLREIYRIFGDMGFQVYRARDVETDEYNFELLNIPAYHPARDMWDTFYTTKPGVILRTHTSPGQVHVMREYCPEPIRVILPGMCYRYEQISARSEIQFHQVEGIMVGKHVTMGDMKGTLTDFARRLFGANARTRLRPSYFPFTEPSGEMDVECFVCHGAGCQVCKNSGWLEILGCGMIHPTVLRNGGYDPSVYSGFAFGMGPERISMLRNQINDIRNFWANDVRFLEQFS
ncbi:phenylalanine--tRNA ligase subunit alpha [Leptolinea tardivitalis]|uniref:Phenylalanine--tRNA ligase alpha subunit n=1 Tax=Leptolinea tardivitalis TaxID=229920 RepID=A0A0P6WX81_9CHLR|nr:phenylalanine--tRNA ligase subunit alpha [Leptolinea tardivitalis]KPL70864.1 phenylalanyl-tRNA synthetase subunit alpha [Leptolinea tardivitalis]GAP20543.1 phenylalanyl-tRNA synthetase, alpha subunit [Leptolinea tardivitalis]